MCQNWTSEWKVMTIFISRELPLINNQCLDKLCTWIGTLSEKLWPFKFLESFRCSISSVSIYCVPESDLRVKTYDHLNLSRASVLQLRMSRYIMHLNRKSEWKVMTNLISRELPLFNFEHLDIWYAESNLRVTSYDNLNFSISSFVQFRTSRYVMFLNRTSVWKVMTIWISWELLLFNFERLNIWCAWIGHPS